MINRVLVIVAISIHIIFQCSFIYCTGHTTSKTSARKTASQVQLLKDIIRRKAYEQEAHDPEKKWLKTEDWIQSVSNKNNEKSPEKKENRVRRSQRKKTTTQVSPEARKTHKSKHENNVEKGELRRPEKIHSKNMDDQPLHQKKSDLRDSLIAEFAEKAQIETKSLRGGRPQLEELDEEGLEIDTQGESNKDNPTQDWRENYSQQGLPWAGNVEKLAHRPVNQLEEDNTESQSTDQDVEKQIRIWTEAHPKKENQALKKKHGNSPWANDLAEKVMQEWKETKLKNEHEQRKQKQQQPQLTSLESDIKEPIITNQEYEIVTEINNSNDESDKSSDSEEKEVVEKEELQNTQSSSERKKILLPTNSGGQKNSKIVSTDHRLGQKLAESMSNEDKVPKKIDFVQDMTDIANDNQTLAEEESKKSLRNYLSKKRNLHRNSSNKCVHKRRTIGDPISSSGRNQADDDNYNDDDDGDDNVLCHIRESTCMGLKCVARCSGDNCLRFTNRPPESEAIPPKTPDSTFSGGEPSYEYEDYGLAPDDPYNIFYDAKIHKEPNDENITLTYAISFQLNDEFVDSLKEKLNKLRQSNLLRQLPKILSKI
ncbi:unnamed protein product [Spodoptera exigua]|nr:unnamed protein product [Spodoptera exigua]